MAKPVSQIRSGIRKDAEPRDGNPVRENNDLQERRANAILLEAIMAALTSCGKVRAVGVRIPVHGNKLGRPVKIVESE